MKRLAIAAVVLFASVSARADYINDYVHAEVGVGGSAYVHGPDGLWYQEGFSHKLNLTAPAISVGLGGDLYQAAHWGVSWHAAYVWLGSVHTDALVPSANTNTTSGKWVGPDLVGIDKKDPCSGPCHNLSRFKGSGHDAGVTVTLEPHYDVNAWRFGFEFGPYFHRSVWSEDVTGWVAAKGDAPTGIHVEYKPEWKLGAVVGLNANYGQFGISYRYYINKIVGTSENPTNPIWSGAHVLMATYRF